MKKIVTLITILVFSVQLVAKEGMWIPMLLNNNISEMQAMGCELSAEDIYSVNHSSLKDAIVSFGGFCTGEFISSKGLVLTNHHCGYGQIQKQSSMEHNYLKDGFWANSMAEELKNPGLYVEQLVYMEDVTNSLVNSGDKFKTIETALIKAKELDNPNLDYKVVPFFNNNQFFLLATIKYNDVRLVGAPPSSIGKFGADTDNWVFPRHTGDFSLFRVYDEAGNAFAPAQHLKVNIAPRTPGEFTMVFGYPGRTQEYLTAVEMDQLVNVENARRVEVRDVLLSIMDEEMRADAAVQLKYASKYARIANGWKKWIGQIEGVQFSKGLDRKRKLEAEFTARLVADANLWDKYSGLLNEIAVNNTQIAEGQLKRNEFIETIYYGMEWFSLMSKLQRAKTDVDRNAALVEFHQNYSRTVSEKTTAAMLSMALETFPNLIGDMDESMFVNTVHDEIDALVEFTMKDEPIDLETVAPTASNFNTSAFQAFYAVSPDNVLLQKATELSAEYMRALMEVFPERNFYPDANSTLRVTYGKLEGVSPRDAVSYGTTTYLDGAMAKYKPGDYEFDMPAKLIELYDNKEYGDYTENGKLPVCNIASNHTTGGNSGSPVLNARGELIGLNFDRIWEGTMSDVNFDANICRNIMVDSRYVLFIIDKFADQRWLIDEMELIK
ncbi:MAG: S46 family peptidase [Schleiferiaceae bacterium]|nr:S46 family peptidase [Schleiferiaceae bacterium]